MSKLLSYLIIVLLIVSPVLAKTSLDLETAGVTARPLGMGKAYLGVADDTNVLFLNSAGLNHQSKWSLTSMSTKLLNRVDYKLIGTVLPTSMGNIGIGYITVSTPAGYRTTTDEASLTGATGINYQTSKLVLSYGRDTVVRNLSLGADLSLYNQGFSGYDGKSSGYGVGLSLLYQPKENLNLGANLKNLISEITWDTKTKENLPLSLKLGGAVKVLNGKSLLALDADLVSGRPLFLHGGMEIKPVEILSVRIGFDQDPGVTNLTGGIGLDISGFRFDYAYHQDSNLSDNSSHYFSISLTGLESYSTAEINEPSKRSFRGRIIPSADLISSNSSHAN